MQGSDKTDTIHSGARRRAASSAAQRTASSDIADPSAPTMIGRLPVIIASGFLTSLSTCSGVVAHDEQWTFHRVQEGPAGGAEQHPLEAAASTAADHHELGGLGLVDKVPYGPVLDDD